MPQNQNNPADSAGFRIPASKQHIELIFSKIFFFFVYYNLTGFVILCYNRIVNLQLIVAKHY